VDTISDDGIGSDVCKEEEELGSEIIAGLSILSLSLWI